MKNIIEVNGLTKSFGNVTALKDCDMEVRRGEIFGYLGHPGQERQRH